ncbi:MAG TPA: nitroreductase family deazaflavin-dependent oxidoreductase [Candidatus Sulfotelmatobacter sp.]|nr:nitroreductase family deazaflavin-dependent oxidoreductase [Candidatus Sulfotelmatobacter sp.]
MSDYNTDIIKEFRENNGKVGGYFDGMDLILLNTIGAKSGKISTVPVAYTKDGDKFVVVASKGGSHEHPAWYFNLLANPEIEIEVGSEKFKAKATNTTGEERERLYNQHAEEYPQFHEYRKKTSREIPVFLLEKI